MSTGVEVCSHMVTGGWGQHLCKNRVQTVRGGKPWCHFHDPEGIASMRVQIKKLETRLLKLERDLNPENPQGRWVFTVKLHLEEAYGREREKIAEAHVRAREEIRALKLQRWEAIKELEQLKARVAALKAG